MEKFVTSLMENLTPEELEKALNFKPPPEPLEPISKVIRTPEERFEGLPGYGFRPHYISSKVHGNIRIHYIDEGIQGAKETMLLLHGEPTWSYLYRHMIPILVRFGYRVVVPDLVGFGRSDKPALSSDHSYERQVDWMCDFVVQADLDQITLFAQDWGGLIGLRVAARLPERFARIAVANTGLPQEIIEAGSEFRIWAGLISQKLPSWGDMVNSMVKCKELSEEEKRAYDAPFPNEESKAASRVYPRLVPQFKSHGSLEENQGAWKRVFKNWKKPFITLFSDLDPITAGGEKVFEELVPGCRGQKHAIIKGAGHFLQEDKPKEICEHLKTFIENNPISKSRI